MDPTTGTSATPFCHSGPDPRFDELYRDSRYRIGEALASALGDKPLGFEAADEAMARAYLHWSKVGSYDNVEGWIYRTGLNWARSRQRRRRLATDTAPLVAISNAVIDEPTDLDLVAALATLTDERRAVVMLRYYNDWSVDMTADALGIAPGTVKSRLSRAIADLRHATRRQPRLL